MKNNGSNTDKLIRATALARTLAAATAHDAVRIEVAHITAMADTIADLIEADISERS